MLSVHDPNWSVEFDALRCVYVETLGNLILGIEHIGSTSVPDLLAKPILDIDLIIRDYSVFDEIVFHLGCLGYMHVGNQGIYQREAFKPTGPLAPNAFRESGWMNHHLYVCPASGRELQRHISFRDALRERADLRREYETIKMNIANRSSGDRQKYAAIKESECSEFFDRVLRQAEQST